MRITERLKLSLRWLLAPLLVGCGATSKAPAPPPPAPEPARPAVAPAPAPKPAAPTAPEASSNVKPAAGLPPPKPVSTQAELRRQAAERLVMANPERTYMTKPPPLLLAIPVLEIELRRDGSVKRVIVMRKPTQALDTVQLAIDAVHRAAPYGDLRRMPEPWVFTETFLFDDQRRFKPRTLD